MEYQQKKIVDEHLFSDGYIKERDVINDCLCHLIRKMEWEDIQKIFNVDKKTIENYSHNQIIFNINLKIYD